MSKTNFDDIDLSGRGIEADEINSESATAGQVLTADGAGGAGWGTTGLVLDYHTDIVTLEDSSDVSWTDVGLPGLGVPAAAKAVLLAFDIFDSAGNLQINFRAKGSGLGPGGAQTPGARALNGGQIIGTLIVPCGAGEVQYYLNASGVETGYAYVTLLGYWL